MSLTRKKKIYKKQTNKKNLRGGSVNPRKFNKIYLGPQERQNGILQPPKNIAYMITSNNLNLLHPSSIQNPPPLHNNNNINFIKSFVTTNTHLAFVIRKGAKLEYVYVSPLELRVDILQYAINSKSITISKSGNKWYLGFNKLFPSLILEYSTSEKDTRRSIENDDEDRRGFFDAYEDKSTILLSQEKNIENFNSNIYENNIKIKNRLESDDKYKDITSIQNIEYVKQISDDLLNDIYTSCDLKDIDKKYIINELFIAVDGVEYRICGYPSHTKMRPYLDLLSKIKDDDLLEKIHNVHKEKYMEYIAELHNFIEEIKIKSETENIIPETEKLKIITQETNKRIIDKTKLDDEIYKFYDTKKFYNNYTIEHLKTFISGQDDDEKKIFENKFIEMSNKYYNKLAKLYLNKPLMRIKYNFLIFKKDETGKYIPAIFNIREISNKHNGVFIKLREFINIYVPKIYNITNGEEYNFFYSYSVYGDFFYIKTEYLHVMSNLTDYSHTYKNSISLEEIIYMTTLNPSCNITDLKLNYQLKKNRIQTLLQTKKLNNNTRKTTNTKSQSYTKKNIAQINIAHNNKILDINPSLIYDAKTFILLMYQESYHKYTFIYKNNNKFYILKINSNLKALTEDIKVKIKNKINKINNDNNNDNSKYINNNIYNCINDNNIELNILYNDYKNLFTIIKHSELSPSEYNILIKYNPLNILNISYLPKTENLNTSYYLTASLENNLDNSENRKNLFKFKPDLVRNYLKTDFYNSGLQKYNLNNLDNIKCNNPELSNKNMNHFKKFLTKVYTQETPDNTVLIQCIYYNINNCGYNFIEIIDYFANQHTVYVIPIDEDPENQIITSSNYLCNFTHLNEKHINMLTELKNIYSIKNKLCFIHQDIFMPTFNCLHFHIIDDDNYIRKYPKYQFGTYILQDIYIDKLINNINLSKTYYYNYNIKLII